MRIDCPHCGRPGTLPEGRALPSRVRCPQCRKTFPPVAATEVAPGALAEEPSWTRCPSCLEPISAALTRCRYCGATRHEARRAAPGAAPTVDDINGPGPLEIDLGGRDIPSNSSGADAKRGSLSGSWIPWFLAGFVAIPLGVFFAGRGSHELGTLIAGLCLIFAVVGLIVSLIHRIWRMLLGS